jgi:acyl CoA:acetate/3-ketoacid CoA transferase alpha subunit
MNDDFHKIKFECNRGIGYKTYIDDVEIKKVIESNININAFPKKATISFFVDVEDVEFEGLAEKIMYTFYEGKKYRLVEA